MASDVASVGAQVTCFRHDGFLRENVYISSKKLFLSYGTGVKIADLYVSL